MQTISLPQGRDYFDKKIIKILHMSEKSSNFAPDFVCKAHTGY